MYIISGSDVHAILTVEDTIGLLRKAYVDSIQGSAVCRARLDVRITFGDGPKLYQWGTMKGGSVESGYFAILPST